MRRPILVGSFALLLLIPLATAQAGQKREAFSFGDVDENLLKQVDLLDQKMVKDGLVYSDPVLDEYVTTIGKTILPADASSPERVSWKFRTVRDPLVNAFALPNGSIYVTTGLLALLENDQQLASVLAHEITHVTDRHSYLFFRSYRKKALAINMISAVGSFAPVNTGVGLTLNVISSVVPAILAATITGYSVELERDADRYALERLAEAGYDPREMARTFELLGKQNELDLTTIYYNDHPKLEARIASANTFASSRPAAANSPEKVAAGRDRFLQSVEAVRRHDLQLELSAGRPRAAVAIAKQLVERRPDFSDAAYGLAEAYRVLGPRTAEPTDDERSRSGIKDAQKLNRKMTLDEVEKELLSRPARRHGRRTRPRRKNCIDALFSSTPQTATHTVALVSCTRRSDEIGRRWSSIDYADSTPMAELAAGV